MFFQTPNVPKFELLTLLNEWSSNRGQRHRPQQSTHLMSDLPYDFAEMASSGDVSPSVAE